MQHITTISKRAHLKSLGRNMGQEVILIHAWKMVTKTNFKHYRKRRTGYILLVKIWFRKEIRVRKRVIRGCLLSVLPPRERGSAPRPIWKRSINNRKPVFQLSQSVQLLVGNLRVGEAKIIERQNNGTCKSLHGQKLYVSDGEYSKRS